MDLLKGACMHVSGLAHVIACRQWLNTVCEEERASGNKLSELLLLLQVNLSSHRQFLCSPLLFP